MIAQYEGPASSALLDVRRELAERSDPLAQWVAGDFRVGAFLRNRHLWIAIEGEDGPALAMRAIAVATGTVAVNHLDAGERSLHVEAATDIGAFRVEVSTSLRNGQTILHSRTQLVPSHHLRLTAQPRDLFVLDTQGASPQTSGRLITRQHGSQTGSLFAIGAGAMGPSIFYLQDFSSLRRYFEDTGTTPIESVGGAWPEMGFRLPIDEEHPLLASNEYVISDAYVALRAHAPVSEGEIAESYLDGLAQIVSILPAPPRSYHNWPERAASTVLDLSQSPECTNTARGRRYLAPYVNTNNKPPESMVQLTVLVALREFERWSGESFSLARELLDGLETFFNADVGTLVRWLPGERFREREDEHQTHEAMDSWYLYHVLFNVARLAEEGDGKARRLLERSLPYAVRVAKRFAYRWPIFFDLNTLDVVQAEAARGSGGENDVSGLYALLMLHAHALFGDAAYFEEAESAAKAMEGFGFGLLYQTNTTGFAAEAALRLWKKTGDRRYYDLMLVALANLFDNMSIWESGYGNARFYSTYFGLYPLRGAPYIAAYEEVEALAKFHEFLRLAGDDVPASVTLLMSEFAKWLLSRGWQYYPGELPKHVLAPKARNGTVRRELSVPLEDLQDGRELSGQVGQEIYGAGLALVCTTRHYANIPNRDFTLFCEYPLEEAGRTRFRVRGDPSMRALVRLIPNGPNAVVPDDAVSITGAKRNSVATRSVEGHVTFEVPGNEIITIKPLRRASRRAKG